MDVGVVIGIYGDLDRWRPLAARAAASAEAQNPAQIEIVESDSLHGARNEGLARLRTTHVCHLDADDELEPGFFAAIDQATADVRVPAVRYVVAGRLRTPIMPKVPGHSHACTGSCLPWGNWIVVGAVAPTDLIRAVGGWRDFPMFEDWDLWARCHLAGATFAPAAAAVYRAHVRRDSRNRAPARPARLEAHQAIARANGLPMPA